MKHQKCKHQRNIVKARILQIASLKCVSEWDLLRQALSEPTPLDTSYQNKIIFIKHHFFAKLQLAIQASI